MIGEVICNTQSRNSCRNDTIALQVTIETGDQLFGGTDSHVSLLLRSSNGIICQVYKLDNNGNDRERNSIDEYTVCCSKQFLDDDNELSMLGLSQLTRSGKYISFFSDDWFIERIQVRANEKLLFDYRFHDWTLPARKLMFGLTKVNNMNYTRF
jgi:hypothetical protein